jgi:hypothetical protein
MSIVTIRRIICDSCEGSGPEASNPDRAEKVALAAGWLVRDGIHHCPTCRRRGKAHPKVAVDVRRVYADEGRWIAVLTTKKGHCWFVTGTGPEPTPEAVRAAWRDDRKRFLPYFA